MKLRKKLIEVALPLDTINAAAAREKGNPFLKGHPRSLHQWWARQPLAAARAVLFSQMVDDPSSHPELYPTESAQDRERKRLFRVIADLVKWESTTNETVLESARNEIRRSWRRTCEDNGDDPRASELFDPDRLPAFYDPFSGGGTIPLEAQRLGLEARASDLNPVAVLINKAMIEIPARFSGKSPVNPDYDAGSALVGAQWKGAAGLIKDVQYYGNWMRDEAEKRIGHLYPKIQVTKELVRERPDLREYEGSQLTVIAWLWARTVKSPNPAFATVDVPLASTFVLSNKRGKEAYIQPVIKSGSFRFHVKPGTPPPEARRGTKSGGSGSSFVCLMSGVPITFEYLRSEAKSGRMGTRMMAIVCEGNRGRIYLTPTRDQELNASGAAPEDAPETSLPKRALGFRVQEYGMTKWRDLFTDRQLMAMLTFSNLVPLAIDRVRADAIYAGMPDDNVPLRDGGMGATAYSEAVACYLALALGKQADYGNTICTWNPTNQNIGHLFTKQAIPMAWDFAEASPIQGGLAFAAIIQGISQCIAALPGSGQGHSYQHDYVRGSSNGAGLILSADPPYYDNVGYADLSDFFYVWLRRSLRSSFPDLFATVAVPKADELVATPFRHASKENAETFFLEGMKRAISRLCLETHPAFPVTIYYAFKQKEKRGLGGPTSTGWETFLDAVVHANLTILGTWPIGTQSKSRMVGQGTNALASSIILVCRKRPTDAPVATRREFIDALRAELPASLAKMQAGNVAPVDLAQSSIGPGMAVFTRYARVMDAAGNSLSVRDALSLINETLDDALAEQEGAFDADTRWALAWFEQLGFSAGEYGVAETLSKAKNTSVSGMVDAGILESGGGKVRLLRPAELAEDWDPEIERRLTVWEAAHHLVRILDQGESAAAEVMTKLGGNAETARELVYRLYRICEQKNRTPEAQSYNALIRSWVEIARLAQGIARVPVDRHRSSVTIRCCGEAITTWRRQISHKAETYWLVPTVLRDPLCVLYLAALPLRRE